MDNKPNQTDSAETAATSLSGRRVVSAMFAFAFVLMGVMWVYIDRHTAPFRPLQQAIRSEFPDSAPQVQGGQRKMHRDTPKTLRITVRVDFDPEAEQDRSQRMVRRLTELAAEHQDLRAFDDLELHLVWFRSEQNARTLTVTTSVRQP